MKTDKWKYNLRRGATLILIVNLLTACYDDRLEPPAAPSGTAVEVSVTLDLPGDVQHQAGTKAMTSDEEQKVDHIHILAFIHDGTDYIYDYTAEGTALNPSGNQLTFKARLKTYPMQQRFMIIANAKDEIEAATLNGKTPAGVQQLLITRQNTEWPARNTVSGPVRSIPMYTLTPAATVTTTTTTLGSYGILRMLARIDIKKNAAVTNFRLTSASLFNRKDRGYIGYNESNWDGSTKVTAPELPGGIQTTKLPTAAYAADSESFLRSIYTFEAEGVTDRKDATAIVIGGYFNYPANNTKETWYRIDIPAYDASGNALPNTMGDILRNHLYEIEIKAITSEGAPTPLEAFEGEVTLEAGITPWNLAKHNIVFDGQFTFSISRNKLVYDRDPATYPVEIYTDHPGGVTVGTPSENWFTVTGLAPGSRTGTLSASVTTNFSNATREATVALTVGGIGGRLDYVLVASQSEKAWVDWINLQIYYYSGYTYNTANNNAPKISSLVNWSATVTHISGNILSSETFTSGGTIGTAVPYAFAIKPHTDNELYHIAEITFKDHSGVFMDKTYPIVNMEGAANTVSNCIIVSDDGAITIPSAYRKAYAIWRCGDGVSGRLGDVSSMGELKGKVIWQDVNGLVSDGNIAYNSSTGALSISSTSSAAGNAVVGLQAGGTTVWSWHIWKPSVTPAAWNGWLNLNLGAVDPGGVGSMGFLYQWGRKDPFPTSATFTSGGVSKVSYDGTGVVVHGATTQGSPSAETTDDNNLANSIRNPFIFYMAPVLYNFDWYTAQTTGQTIINELGHNFFAHQNNYLWHGKSLGKTPFDPCPNGYRVPVLGNESPVDPWSGSFPALTIASSYHYCSDNTGNIIIPWSGYRLPTGQLTQAGNSAVLASKFTITGAFFGPPILWVTSRTDGLGRITPYTISIYNLGDYTWKATGRTVRCQQGE